MQITRNSTETAAGPNEWFTGSVYIDAIAAPSNGSRLSVANIEALNSAARAEIVMPGVFAFADQVIGNPQTSLFAAFGSWRAYSTQAWPNRRPHCGLYW